MPRSSSTRRRRSPDRGASHRRPTSTLRAWSGSSPRRSSLRSSPRLSRFGATRPCESASRQTRPRLARRRPLEHPVRAGSGHWRRTSRTRRTAALSESTAALADPFSRTNTTAGDSGCGLGPAGVGCSAAAVAAPTTCSAGADPTIRRPRDRHLPRRTLQTLLTSCPAYGRCERGWVESRSVV